MTNEAATSEPMAIPTRRTMCSTNHLTDYVLMMLAATPDHVKGLSAHRSCSFLPACEGWRTIAALQEWPWGIRDA